MTGTGVPSRFFAMTLVLSACLMLISGCGQDGVSYKNPSKVPGSPIAADKQVTIDDLLFTEYVSEMRMSPDGKRIAWVKTGNTRDTDVPSSNIFVSNVSDLATTQVTGLKAHSFANLRWSPDSTSIAYLSDAPLPGGAESSSAMRPWYAQPGSKPPAPLDTGGLVPVMLEWKSADSIVIAAIEASKEEPVDDTIHVSDYAADPVRLYALSPREGVPKKITSDKDNMTALSVSPDGKKAFIVRTRGTGINYYADKPHSYNYLVDLESGSEKKILDQTRTVMGVSWAPDSSRLYVVEAHSSDSKRPMSYTCRLQAVNPTDGSESLLDLGWERGIESMSPFGYTCPLVGTYEGGFAVILADGYHPKVALFYAGTKNTPKRTMLQGPDQGNIFSLVVAPDGKTVCYENSSATRSVQLYVARLEGDRLIEPKQLTRLNPDFENRQVSRAENITWKGARGDTVEGLLYYPVDYRPGKRYPLVFMIHGGPFECDKDRWPTSGYTWVDPYRLMNQKGAFALSVNYHGSSGYGKTSEDWGDSMADSKFYGYPLEDFEAAIDRLVGLGMVDADRLATTGWSGGGMLSNALIARDQRFKAASCGAGGAEWVSMWGPCEFGDTITTNYFGKDPIEDPGLFKDPETNPFYDAAKVKTPTIMFTGDADVNVPASMTWVTYRGIQKHGNAPVELFIAPGEPHVYEQVSHQRRKVVEEQKWFDRHLFGTVK